MQPLQICIGPKIRIGQEIQCLPCAGFFIPLFCSTPPTDSKKKIVLGIIPFLVMLLLFENYNEDLNGK